MRKCRSDATALGTLAAAAGMAVLPNGQRRSAAAVIWAAAGVIYAGVILISPIVLRRDPELGFAALAFLFATVWATDIFAYLIGRRLGGPLLAPRISPKKTWAGAIGGLAGGVVAGGVVAYASAGTQPVAAGVLALVLSIAAQGGDLLESAVKRRFDAKDTSTLIPGHALDVEPDVAEVLGDASRDVSRLSLLLNLHSRAWSERDGAIVVREDDICVPLHGPHEVAASQAEVRRLHADRREVAGCGPARDAHVAVGPVDDRDLRAA